VGSNIWAASIVTTLALLNPVAEGKALLSVSGTNPAHAFFYSPSMVGSILPAKSRGMNAMFFVPFTLSPTEASGDPGYPNPQYAYDGDQTTASYVVLGQVGKGADARLEDWFGFPSAPAGATGMTLNVTSAGVATGDAYETIEYSLDGGQTYQTLYNVNGSRTEQTDSVSLADNQDLTQIRVRAQAGALVVIPTGRSSITHWVYEIWISGD
jgi:hypothetical protein